MRVRPVQRPELFCRGARPACLTSAAGGEPSGVPGLGQDAGGAGRGQAGDRGDQAGQAQIPQDGDHPLLGAGQTGLGARQPATSNPARSSAPWRSSVTPAGPAQAANTPSMIFCPGLTASQRATWRRTAALKRTRPSRVTEARSPPARASATVSAACQVMDFNGCRAASSTAGHAHSSRSRICCTSATCPATRRARRMPSWRHRAQVAPAGAGRPQRSCAARQVISTASLSSVLAGGQVLGPPGPGAHQRLHAYERHPALGGQLPSHPPPVPSRLDRHTDPSEPAAMARAAAQPSAAPSPQGHRRNLRRASTRGS